MTKTDFEKVGDDFRAAMDGMGNGVKSATRAFGVAASAFGEAIRLTWVPGTAKLRPTSERTPEGRAEARHNERDCRDDARCTRMVWRSGRRGTYRKPPPKAVA